MGFGHTSGMLCGDNTTQRKPCQASRFLLDVLADKLQVRKKVRSPDDRWTLPLCGKHHRLQHEQSERYFWAQYFIDPIRVSSPRLQSRICGRIATWQSCIIVV